MQLNCHKSRNVHTSLEADTPKTGLYIYFLQETYNHLLNPCGLTKSFLHYLPDTNCRAAIYAPPKLGLTFHPNLSSRNCATASVTIEGEKGILLLCILRYSPYSRRTSMAPYT
jgi:hypothetical protein